MKVTITPRKLSGTIQVPPSKSQAHRLIIGAALANGTSHIHNLAHSQDICATLECMTQLGAIESQGGAVVTGIGHSRPSTGILPVLDCGESGSTIRFLMPVALAVASGGVFRGRGRLMERPYKPYEDIFTRQNITFTRQPGQITLSGTLKPGRFELPGDVSSQFITGLLYALPLLEGDSELVLTTPLESRGYVELTLEALAQFGIVAHPTETGWKVPGSQVGHPADVTVEGDYSQASNYLVAASMGNPLTVTGLSTSSAQGDRIICDYARQLDGTGTVILSVRQCPDLVPALAVRAALRAGETTHIVDAARLRLKESDRLEAVTAELNKLGAQVEQTPDALIIHGVSRLHGGTCDSHGDHRIAMMLAVAATCADGVVEVTGAESVAKSYPNFWEDYEQLGGTIARTE